MEHWRVLTMFTDIHGSAFQRLGSSERALPMTELAYAPIWMSPHVSWAKGLATWLRSTSAALDPNDSFGCILSTPERFEKPLIRTPCKKVLGTFWGELWFLPLLAILKLSCCSLRFFNVRNRPAQGCLSGKQFPSQPTWNLTDPEATGLRQSFASGSEASLCVNCLSQSRLLGRAGGGQDQLEGGPGAEAGHRLQL